jgi:predicted transcriptional regulator
VNLTGYLSGVKHMAADQYTRVMGDIQALFRSRLQIQILLALQEENQTLANLREKTGSSSQALIPKIRGLESQMLVEQRNYEYILTPLGRVLSDRIIDFVSTIGAIRKHKDFWASHDLTGIPPQFLSSVGKLVNSEIIFDTSEDVIHVYTLYLKIVKEASQIYGVSAVMSPGLAESLSARALEGIPVELVVNSDAAHILSQEPYLTPIKDLLNCPNFKIWVTKVPLKVGLTVTDKCISLGMFKKDGKMYDSSTDLFSVDADAIRWGEELFRYFRRESDPLTL